MKKETTQSMKPDLMIAAAIVVAGSQLVMWLGSSQFINEVLTQIFTR